MTPSPRMMHAFGGHTAVVTGAASGIGRSLARLLAAAGAEVHAVDFDREKLGELNRDLPAVRTYEVDVSDAAAFEATIESITSVKPIDYLFNNAGVTLLGEAQNLPFTRWKWLMDINLMGVIHGCRTVYPKMLARGHGHIVNTASVAGRTGYATATAYAASKAAVLELSRSLGAEGKSRGVLVSAACPGYVSSAIFSQDRVVGAEVSKIVSDLPVGMMTPDYAAFRMLEGVARKKRLIVFPFSARILWSLASWMPSSMKPFQLRFLRMFKELDTQAP